MIVNLSFLQVPIEYGNKKLKDNMTLTGSISEKASLYYPIQPLYRNFFIDFNKLHRYVKSDYIQYSSFSWDGGYKNSERFNNENQNLLILDIDDGLSLSQAKTIFNQYKYLICTTKSHQKDKKGVICDRFRIILPCMNIPIGDFYFDFIKEIEIKFPFIDKQVNTKTGSFLGFSECQYWYSDGILFDCKPYANIAKARKEIEIRNKKEIVKRDSNYDIEVSQIKERLTPDIVRDILNAHGFDVDRNYKLKLRNERTPSTSISRDCLIKDFGSDFTGDVFSVLMEYRGKTFKDSVAIVGGYV